MNSHMKGQTDRQKESWTDRLINELMYRQMKRQIEQTDGLMNAHTHRLTGRNRVRQTE